MNLTKGKKKQFQKQTKNSNELKIDLKKTAIVSKIILTFVVLLKALNSYI